MTLREKILASDDRRCESVEVPEWQETVFIRVMTAAERDSLDQQMIRDSGDDEKISLSNFRARLAVRVIVDDKGERIFADGDADELGRKSAVVLDRIYGAAMRLNALRKEDVDELAKKSKPGPDADSPSV